MSHQEGDPRHCGLCAKRGGPHLPEIPSKPTTDEDIVRSQYERLRQVPAVMMGPKKTPASTPKALR
jgi:hypothetical protein